MSVQVIVFGLIVIKDRVFINRLTFNVSIIYLFLILELAIILIHLLIKFQICII